MAALAPWQASQSFLNFAETPREFAQFVDDQTLGRLRDVKATYDPADRIRAHQPVRAAEPATA